MQECKRFVTSIILAMYLIGLTPVSVFSQQNKTVSYKIPAENNEKIESAFITRKTGGVIKIGEAEIEIPAKALRKDTKISITKLNEVAKLSEGMGNVTTGSIGYRFEPKGTKFKKDVIIRMGFDKSLKENKTILSNLYTYYYDEKTKNWKALERIEIDTKECVIVSKTNHFTDMINATLSEIEGEKAEGVNINQIKNLEAADPNTGITQLEGIEVNNQGSASFYLNFDIPGGRKGIKPQVTLQYSSDGGSGDCGIGFNLNASKLITIDTRYGLPKYTLDGDREHYLLNGNKLIFKGEEKGKALYRTESERGFEKIEAILENGKIKYWEVTDKAGKKETYGKENGWTGRTENEKYEWKIERLEDVRGNNIKWTYQKDRNALYLSEISYTGKGYREGNYKVKFEIEDRNDKRSNARGKYVIEENKRYSKITITYNENEVWNYKLKYTENAFGKSELKSISKGKNEKEYWNYEFEYIGVTEERKKEERITGWQGFGTVEQINIPQIGKMNVLSKSGSSGGGVNINGSARFYIWLPFIGKSFGATVGVSSGYQNSMSATNVTIIDITGDGIGDLVYQEDDTIKYFAGNGKGFDDVEKTYGTIGEVLDKSIQNTFSVGLNADLAGIVDGSITGQTGNSYSTGQFMDMDGDGYVDYLVTGKEYYKNDGTGFKKTSYKENTDAKQEENTEFKINKNAYLNTYSTQELLLGWEGKYEGEVEINYEIKESIGKNIIKTYIGNDEEIGIETRTKSIKDRDFIYFLVDTGNENEENSKIKFDIEIGYKNQKRYGYFENKGLIKPEKEVDSIENEISNLYVKNEESGKYELLKQWEEILTVEQAGFIIDKGLFEIGQEIDIDVFEKLLGYGNNKNQITVQTAKGIESVSEDRAFLSCYKKDNLNGIYVLKTEKELQENKLSDGNIYNPENYLKTYITNLSLEEKITMFYCPIEGYENSYIYPFGKKGNRYYKTSLENLLESRIDDKETKGLVLDKEESQIYIQTLKKDGLIYEYVYTEKLNPQEITETFYKDNIENKNEKINKYYEYNNENNRYSKKENLTEDEEIELSKEFLAIGIQFFSKETVSIIYESQANFQVEDEKIEIEVIKNNKIEKKELTSKKMNASSLSYNDGTVIPSNENVENYYRLQGGYNHWFYGLWTGFYEFTENKLKSYELLGNDLNPINMTLNGEVKPIEKKMYLYGFSQGNEYLKGEETTITQTTLNSKLQEEVKVTKYSAKLKTETNVVNYESNRFGGDAYQKLPKYIGGMTGSGLSKIRSSQTESQDINGGINIVGISENIGSNKGSSKQNQGIMDIDGDRIPDSITINENKQLTYYPGSLTGFKSSIKGSLMSGMLNENTISSVTVGLGTGVGGGGTVLSTKANGNLDKIQLVSQDPPKGGDLNIGINGGLTGSVGSNEIKVQFADMNGDGLVDQVRREGKGSYKVRLNIGDGNFTSTEYDWGGTGKSIKILSESANKFESYLYKEAEGIAATATGSVGVNLGANGSIGIISGSIGGTLSNTVNQTFSTLQDINGDGLVDAIYKSKDSKYFSVLYNKGDKFSEEFVEIYRPDWNITKMEEQLENMIKSMITEIRGNSEYGEKEDIKNLFNFDANKIKEGNPVKEIINPLAIEDVIDYSTGMNLGISVGVSGTVMIPFCDLTLGTGTNFQYGQTTSTVKFMDINGDGLPDHIAQIAGSDKAYVKYNNMGKVGLLKKIYLPQGGEYIIEYESSGNTLEQPYHKYVMSKLVYSTGKEGIKSLGTNDYIKEFSYLNGKYHRTEREFYGYNKVIEESTDSEGNRIGSIKETLYSNDLVGYDKNENEVSGYYKKGIVESKKIYSEDGKLYQESNYVIDNYPYARVVEENTSVYDVISGEDINILTEYTGFDDWGNITSYIERVKNGSSVQVEIDYTHNESKYLHSLPEQIRVYDENGKLLRQRKGIYNNYGELISLTRQIDSYNSTTTKYEYDDYGNLSKIQDARGAFTQYEYDRDTNQFVESIKQGSGFINSYETQLKWDKSKGLKLSETDENNQTMTYQYDEQGRLQKIYSPYDEVGGVPAVEYIYNTEKKGSWWTETKNKVSFDCDDEQTLSTVVQIDGLGRKVKVAKFAEKTDQNGNTYLGWNVSGVVEYDSKGRTIKEGQSYFSNTIDSISLVNEPLKLHYPTVTQYDSFDRVIKTILPDESTQKTEYGIKNGKTYTLVTDPEGNKTKQEKDARENIVSVVRYDKFDKELTRTDYQYNVLGEMLEALDAQANPITIEYDMLGRKIVLESKDSGRKEYIYDEASNLIEETDSNLREKGVSIKYTYDGLNRLTNIDYPYSTDVTYYYGNTGDENNGANRVIQITDETGMKSLSYGLLGEVVEESRTIGEYTRIEYNEQNKYWYNWWHIIKKGWWNYKHHKWYHKHHRKGKFKHHYPWYGEEKPDFKGAEFADGAYTAKMSYTSDYLGRMNYITYPDGETVSYSYDAGGQVTKVTGERNGVETVYIAKIGYDEYGQRSFIEYGNGVKTSYTYDENRRWLDSIKTLAATDRILQNMNYTFDKVGNVSGYENTSSNYTTKQNYQYDSLYQLVEAKGETEYKPHWNYDKEDPHTYISTYEQSFRFDNIGNMKSKYSEVIDNPSRQHASNDLNYSFEYTYDNNYAHRTINADNMYYTYDANGNIINERIDRQATKEELQHDVELAEGVYSLDYGIALPNQPDVETKEYSRTYIWNEKNQLKSSVENGFVVQYRYGEDGQRAVKSSLNGETLYFNNMWQMSTTAMGMRQTKHIFVGETRIATKNNWWQNASTDYEKYNTYYYHSDHLGSAQLITDYKGQEYERIEYTPYGELWIEKVKKGFESINYRFTGKEMDSETGLYYFGARYLDPKYSRWLSTDPALGEYIPQAPVNDEAKQNNQNLPGMGGLFNQVNFHLYHYAGNNPVRYIDPDGRSVNIPIPSFIFELEQIGQEFKNASPQLAAAGCIILGVVLLFEGINYAQNKSLSNSLEKINSASVSVLAGAPAPLPPDDPDSKGTRVSSKTLYNKKGIHIDVENPGHRPGQIHIQKDNAKYLYDVGKKAFVDKTGELAPKVFQKLLEDPKVIKAISKGLEILGY